MSVVPTVEDALYDRLVNYGDLSALIGDRVHPVKLPQNPTLPAVSYVKISAAREVLMGADPGMASPVFQFDCWAETYTEAKDVCTRLRQALERYNGVNAGVTIHDCYIVNETDAFESPVETFHVMLDVQVWHNE